MQTNTETSNVLLQIVVVELLTSIHDEKNRRTTVLQPNLHEDFKDFCCRFVLANAGLLEISSPTEHVQQDHPMTLETQEAQIDAHHRVKLKRTQQVTRSRRFWPRSSIACGASEMLFGPFNDVISDTSILQSTRRKLRCQDVQGFCEQGGLLGEDLEPVKILHHRFFENLQVGS